MIRSSTIPITASTKFQSVFAAIFMLCKSDETSISALCTRICKRWYDYYQTIAQRAIHTLHVHPRTAHRVRSALRSRVIMRLVDNISPVLRSKIVMMVEFVLLLTVL